MAAIADRAAAIDAKGTQVAFVHMHPESQALAYFARYGAGDFPRVSDPRRRLYAAFELSQATASNWLSLATMRRYFEAIFRRGHLPALVGGSVRQMPGAFLIANGAIVKAFRHESVGDRLDLDDLTTPPRSRDSR